MKIALYTGSWPQNIGNAFFDLGLEAIIKSAFPDAQLFYTGGAVHWMFSHANGYLFKVFPYQKDNSVNSFEIAQYANVDLVAVPGMCISKEFVDNNGKTFMELAKREIPVVFVGAGALEYTKDEVSYYADFLNAFYKFSIITRDENTFNMLKEQGIGNIHRGIDCAFFLPERYTPPEMSLPAFNILNFDNSEEPTGVDHQNNLILRTHHDSWGPLSDRYTREENSLISDVPFDYLTLYANVNETYSDRVHACIATLTYGNKARLFSETPRASLFEELGVGSIVRELVKLDTNILSELKDRQIESVIRSVNEII